MSIPITALRLGATLLGAAALAVLSGCTTSGTSADVEGPVTIYVSLPLSGPRAADGLDAADGARLAFEQARKDPARPVGPKVRARFLDDAAGADPQVAAAANARIAVKDSSTGAYIGELDSAPTRNSLPILNDAGIAQISPGAGAVDLTGPNPDYEDSPDRYQTSGRATFARLVPTDSQLAKVKGRLDTGDSVEAALDPASLPAGGAHTFLELFSERFGRQPGPYAAYGYEAMGLALDSISEAAGRVQGFRTRVVDELLSATRLDSPLGDYGITNDGDTTLCLVQPYRGAQPLKPVCAGD